MISVYWSNPATPFCRPTPLSLYPPNGVRAVRSAAVDADEAGLDSAGHRQGVLQRTRHDVAGQSVFAVVGDANGVFLVVERDDREHRAEDLLLGDGHGVVDVGEKRWSDEESFVETGFGIRSAHQRRGTLFDALADVAHHPVSLLLRNHWAAEGSGILRVTTGDVLVDALEDRHPSS